MRAGQLAPEHHLPPIRRLATTLGTSPATVAAAYRGLRERGLVVADGRRGTIVTPRPPLAGPAPRARVPEGVRDLRTGLPDPDLLPDPSAALAAASEAAHRQAPRTSDPRLVELAAAGFRREGIDAPGIAVVSGALDGIERVLQAHLARGDRVAVEDPSYPPVLDLLGALGATPVPVTVDEEGLMPGSLAEALDRRVAALIVTPRAQNPTGAALSRRRVGALRRVLAGHEEVLIVEDDHAGAASGAEPLTLVQPARRPKWAIARSVTKTLGPDLRVAVLTGDATTLARVEGRQMLGPGWVSTILQRTVAALWEDGEAREIVARAGAEYERRREALIAALAEHGIRAHGRSGLNVWVPVREEAPTVEALLARGWAVSAGERFRLRAAPAVRVTVAGLRLDEVPALARDIAEATGAATRVF